MQAAAKKIHTPQQALLKLRDWCAYQERCQQEVRDKLYALGLHYNDVENLLSQLISENFVNEERFAKAFAGGKFRMKKWGRIKIKNELKARRLSEYCIRKGLAEINSNDYFETLRRLIRKKEQEVKEKNPLRKKQKLLRYTLGKGYEQELIFEILNNNYED